MLHVACHALLSLSHAPILITLWLCLLTGAYETSLSPYYNTPPQVQSSPLLLGGFFWCHHGHGLAFAKALVELVVVYGGGSGVRMRVACSRDRDHACDFCTQWG